MSLIDLIPPMLSNDQLKSALQYLPPYDASVRNKDKTTRLAELSALYDVYYPSEMSAEIYTKVYLSLIHSLRKKEGREAIRQYKENWKAAHKKSYSAILGGADSFSIIGKSGLGKSAAIGRTIDLINQNGIVKTENPFRTIIPCLVVQCPFDSSVRGLMLEILRKIDETIQTTYYEKALKRGATVDMLIGTVSSAALNHIGIIICDEIQNVATSKNGKALVGALTQLINNSGISIGMVGTPESASFFMQQQQLARRSIGLYYEEMPYDDYFFNLCNVLWNYQYVRNPSELKEGTATWLYEHSNGNVSIIVTLIHDAQEIAIMDDNEILSLKSLEKAYRNRLGLLSPFIQFEEKKKRSAISKAKSESLPLSPTKGICEVDLEEIAKISKTQGIDMVELLADKITVTEVQL